jgi:hypothetical protein
MHNARVIALMEGNNVKIDHIECELLNTDMTSEYLYNIKPTVIINSAALLSLYPFFPSLKKRQEKMNFVAGFAHTLPKDLAILWPLMKAVKSSCPNCLVINLAAPDIGNAILQELNLSPDIGAGTIDSTVQGIKLAVFNRAGLLPGRLDVRMVCHHALRRFSPNEVPFFLQIRHKDIDITEEFDLKELIQEATDVSGVETMTTPVSNNAAITAASAVATAQALLANKKVIRHAPGTGGQIGGAPVRLGSKEAEIVLPDAIGPEDAVRINTAGMNMSGVDRIDKDGTITFTERERYWLKQGMGLDWNKMRLEDAFLMSGELKAAYRRLLNEEVS